MAEFKEFVKVTEMPSIYQDIDKMTPREVLECMNKEDHKIADAIQLVIPQIEKFVIEATKRMKDGGRLFYIGSGSSGRFGIVDASEVPPTYGMPYDLIIAVIAGGDAAIRFPVEGAEDDWDQGWKDILKYNPTEKDCIVGIAASGTTPYTMGALTEARKIGMFTGCITANAGSPMTQIVDVDIAPYLGPEFITASSRMKSGTSQKIILNMITNGIMIGMGRVKGNKMVNMHISNKKLVDRGTRMLIDYLGLPYEECKELLLKYGGVQKALDGYAEEQKNK